MKRLLPLLSLALLAGCATYPDYGYYDDRRSHDRYDSREYVDGSYSASDGYYDDGGDYYYSTRRDRQYNYDDSFYGYGPSYGYGGYGYGGYGGYGGSLGYGFGSRPRLGIGFGFSSGGHYPYGGYYPYSGYSGYSGYYGSHRPYRYDRYDGRDRRGDRQTSRDRYSRDGDGVIDNDASNLADQVARERGVRDATPRSFDTRAGSGRGSSGNPRNGDYSRDRDSTPQDNRWRSDFRDAQLASPRAAGAGDAYSRDSQLRMEPAQPVRDSRQEQRYRDQSMPRTQPVETWRGNDAGGWSRARNDGGAQARFQSSQGQSFSAPQTQSTPQRSRQSETSRPEPRERGSQARSYSRERDATEAP